MMTSGRKAGFALLLLFSVIGIVSIALVSPPAVVSADAPSSAFSAQRAAIHLRQIAVRPHPMGSVELARVRAYLLQELTNIGYAPVLQTATLQDATVQNILVRVPGADHSRHAVLFDAHYDSSRGGPGAGDNGVAVAAMLEMLRALRAGTPLRHDVIAVFSDGEEAGLLGAQAVLRHPWMQDVKAVFNFDARGVKGPVVMFETGGQNRWVIREFARAVPYPLANSLSDEIYQIMPNRTHFTIYKEAGYSGLNFAFMEGSEYYHTPGDNLRHVDARTIQHVGSCMLGLTRHFGTLDFAQASQQRGDAVYCNLLGKLFIHYPRYLVVPLLIGISFFAGIVLVLGFRKKVLALPGILLGSVFVLLMTVIAFVMALGAPYVSSNITTQFTVSLAVSAVVSWIVYRIIRLRIPLLGIAAGIALWWLALALVMGVALPAGSHLFFWPALLGWCGIGAGVLTSGKATRVMHPLFFSPAGLACLLLWCPMLYLIFIAIPALFPGLVVVAIFMLSLLLCSLDALAASPRAL